MIKHISNIVGVNPHTVINKSNIQVPIFSGRYNIPKACSAISNQSMISLEKAIPIRKKWDINYYGQKNKPEIIGKIFEKETFSSFIGGHGYRFLDLPLHFPRPNLNSTSNAINLPTSPDGWKIPVELEQFMPMIEQVVAHELKLDPDFCNKYYVYITVDQNLEVQPYTSQRREGWHGDSYIRSAPTLDVDVDHVYIAYDSCPTPFSKGPFDLYSIDTNNVDEVLSVFESGASKDEIDYYPPYTILKMDPYCVHNVGVNNSSNPVKRTFVKISVSPHKYCKLGNLKNPLFNYDWPLVPRHGVPYSLKSLEDSSHRSDRDHFIAVDTSQVDFVNETVHKSLSDLFAKEEEKGEGVSLVTQPSPKFRWYSKMAGIKAIVSKPGDMLTSSSDGFLITINVAKEGDWKITPENHNDDEYFLSSEKLHKFYYHVKDDYYLPKYIPRKTLEITKDIYIRGPWGTLQYGKIGDHLMYLPNNDESNDIYIVPKKNIDQEFRCLSINIDDFDVLHSRTNTHKEYLRGKGLGDRADLIAFEKYDVSTEPFANSLLESTDSLNIENIPQEVLDFDSSVKNTVITTDPDPLTPHNSYTDIREILDIRLYPVLKDLITVYPLDIFMGESSQMHTFYKKLGYDIKYKIKIPSSATYYLATSQKDISPSSTLVDKLSPTVHMLAPHKNSQSNNTVVIMANLVSRDNVIAQLITLKIANCFYQDKIKIIGKFSSFHQSVCHDIDVFVSSLPLLHQHQHAQIKCNTILIVASCGELSRITGILDNNGKTKAGSWTPYHGSILSAITQITDTLRYVVVELKYGEIMETIVDKLLHKLDCVALFSGGACGNIGVKDLEIGTFVQIERARSYKGEIVSNTHDEDEGKGLHMPMPMPMPIHMHVNTIFFETYEWLDKMRVLGGLTVDVESFYILKSALKYEQSHGLKRCIGCFISDNVGRKALRSYKGVYANLEQVLIQFLNN